MPNLGYQSLKDAFDSDGYDIDKEVRVNNKLGLCAKHRTACINGDPLKPKKAYYLEGSHWEMGYLLGLMAEDDIVQMTTNFVNNMIFELVFWHPRASADPHDPAEQTLIDRVRGSIGNALMELFRRFSEIIKPDIPPEYLEELAGILAGCQAANDHTAVIEDDLWVLNFGIDWFLANLYSGLHRFVDLRTAISNGLAGINPPGMCNGFSLSGEAAGGKHFFGRDFMFPTAGVFEKTACLIVYNPDSTGGVGRFPFVSLTAPGLMGCVSGMNRKGVAIGVEVAPAAACDPDHPGFNSLLLNRYSIETGGTAVDAKNVIVNAKRGVPWIYIIADGANDKACVVEAVNSRPDIPFTEFPPASLLKGCLFCKPLLPKSEFLRDNPTAVQENGVMVRWADYAYKPIYLTFNKKLFKRYDKTPYPDAFDEKGSINRMFTENKCPHMYYFAPERESRTDMVITTNHFIIPEMRYTAMDPWLALIFEKLIQDSQWRYDALNKMILDALERARQNGQNGVDYETARRFLRFIDPTPDGEYPDYYGPDKKSIEGAHSLFDLKELTIESHYGYYVDDWLKLSLRNYIP